MKNIHVCCLVVLALSFIGCKTAQFDKQPPFTIVTANYNYWSGGQPGVGGTKVTIEYTMKNSVEFDSIYFQKKVVKVALQQAEGKMYVVGFFNKERSNEVVGQIDAKTKESVDPFQLAPNDAVLSYRSKGKTNYFKVVNLKEVSPAINQ